MSDAPELTVTGVTKRFGGLVAVSQASLAIRRGRIQGLIGPNGAGKSTMIGLITGFLSPDAGEITLAGHCPHPCICSITAWKWISH